MTQSLAQPPPQTPGPQTSRVSSGNNSCVTSARANLALHEGVDALGLLGPAGGSVGTIASLASAAGGFGLAAMDFGGHASGGEVGGAVGSTVAGFAIDRASEAEAGLALGRVLPGFGALVSGYSMYRDYQNYKKTVNACTAGGG